MMIELYSVRGDSRPHASGSLRGECVDTAKEVDVDVEWLIDLGSQLTCVRQSTAAPFAWQQSNAVGQRAYGTNGGPAIPLGYGPTVVVGDLNGTHLTYRDWLGVKQTDHGSDLVGTDALDEWGVAIEWSTGDHRGRLM